MAARAPLVFIASPLTHVDAEVTKKRIEIAARFAAWVTDTERKNTYPAAVVDGAVGQFQQQKNTIEWWLENMRIFMEPAEACYVLCLEGWEKSSGVAAEIKVAQECGKPVYYYQTTPTGFERTSHGN